MGKGIAVEFKRRFGRVQELQAQKPTVGGIVVLHKERYIYYLVTKQKYWQKPSYKSLEASLKAMYAHAVKHNVHAISLPKIGCGLDRLDWDRVEQMLKDIFPDIDITIYSL